MSFSDTYKRTFKRQFNGTVEVFLYLHDRTIDFGVGLVTPILFLALESKVQNVTLADEES